MTPTVKRQIALPENTLAVAETIIDAIRKQAKYDAQTETFRCDEPSPFYLSPESYSALNCFLDCAQHAKVIYINK